jgi:hypothetical protein
MGYFTGTDDIFCFLTLGPRKPTSITRLEKRRDELSGDLLARFRALLRMHATKGIQALPAKQKWKQLGD